MSWFSVPGRHCARCADEQGFTLIEVLVALVILGMLVVGSMEAFGMGLQAQRAADRHLEALALADARLNELATEPADSLLRRPALRDGRFAPPLERYAWQATVRRLPGSRTVWTARVVVSWDEGQETLETAFFRPVERFEYEHAQTP